MDMKHWMAAAMTAAVATAAWAGPFNPADVPAEAAWFAHVDVDQLKATQVGKSVMEQLTTGEADKKFAALQAVFNFDPRKDLSGLTVCGTGNKSYALLRGKFDAERLVTLLRANEAYQATTQEGYTVHSWLDENKAKKKGPDKARMFGAFHASGAIVISEEAGVLTHALAVLDGKKPASAFKAPTPSGTVPFMVGTVSDLSGTDPKNAVLKLARGGTVILGEDGDRVKGRLAIETTDSATASNLLKVAEGMRSALLLNTEKDPRAAKLAGSASVALEGQTVSVQLDFPASEIAQAIREEAAKKQEKKAE